MSDQDFGEAVEHYHAALDEVVRGNPALMKNLISRRDDVTLANPIGPLVQGWSEVEKTMDRAISQLSDGEPNEFEVISMHAGPDLGYLVENERSRMKVGGSGQLSSVSLRVTTIFRREDGVWKMLHRHADPITTPRPIESIVHQE